MDDGVVSAICCEQEEESDVVELHICIPAPLQIFSPLSRSMNPLLDIVGSVPYQVCIGYIPTELVSVNGESPQVVSASRASFLKGLPRFEEAP